MRSDQTEPGSLLQYQSLHVQNSKIIYNQLRQISILILVYHIY